MSAVPERIGILMGRQGGFSSLNLPAPLDTGLGPFFEFTPRKETEAGQPNPIGTWLLDRKQQGAIVGEPYGMTLGQQSPGDLPDPPAIESGSMRSALPSITTSAITNRLFVETPDLAAPGQNWTVEAWIEVESPALLIPQSIQISVWSAGDPAATLWINRVQVFSSPEVEYWAFADVVAVSAPSGTNTPLPCGPVFTESSAPGLVHLRAVRAGARLSLSVNGSEVDSTVATESDPWAEYTYEGLNRFNVVHNRRPDGGDKEDAFVKVRQARFHPRALATDGFSPPAF